MFGNIMNHNQLRAAIKARDIAITPFNEKALKNIHYTLTPEKILQKSREDVDGAYSLKVVRDFSSDPSAYVFDPGEFAIIEIEEHLSLKEFIVGHFIPTSVMVQKGLGLTAGRIEAPFGSYKNRKNMIRLAVKNLTEHHVRLKSDENVAHIYFVDLRGLDNYTVPVSPQQDRTLMDWNARRIRADDDGPIYQADD